MKRPQGGWRSMSWTGPGRAGHTDRFAKVHEGRTVEVEVETAGLDMDQAKRVAFQKFLREVSRNG